MTPALSRGYLVLVDISGFTRFVARTELEHSQAILSEIFKLILRRFAPSLEVAEIEGDAVFAYAPDGMLQRGETLLEIIETTYIEFRDQQKSVHRMVTCQCRACQMSGSLDLKFITHFGDFAFQDVSGKRKPLGSSVNLIHRLLKNTVTEKTGWRGYALFTEESLRQMDIHPLNIHAQTESYEHLGDVQTYCINLHERYEELTAERVTILRPEEADVRLTREFPVPPPLLWEWLNDPAKRLQWMLDADWQKKERPQGRMSSGATNHCINSGVLEHVLDWRPFSYYTVEFIWKFIRLRVTISLEPVARGTRLFWNARLHGSLPRWMLRPLCKVLVAKGVRTQDSFAVLAEILSNDKASQKVA